MRKIIFIILVSWLMSSCTQGQFDSSNSEIDSLRTALNERETFINNFISSFNEVERNLDSVAIQQHIIYVNADKSGWEFNPTQKERINANISAINKLMNQNRKRISELSHHWKNSANKNQYLEKAIGTFKKQLVQKNIELTALNEKLTALNAEMTQLHTSVDTLNAQYASKLQTISEQTQTSNTVLNTVYYVVGKSKDLQEAQLIDREGGLLGIGKTSKLNGDFDNSKFIQIDYTKTNTIPVNKEDAKIITSHPSDSYTLDKDDKGVVKNLLITNPKKFWSASKYLVVVHS